MAVVPSTRKTQESAIERELVQRVEALGGRCEKVTVIGRRGFFDRLVVLPGGRVIFVECKRPHGATWAAHQRQYFGIYRTLGLEVALIKKSEDIDRLLSAPTEKTPAQKKGQDT